MESLVLAQKLYKNKELDKKEWLYLLSHIDDVVKEKLTRWAAKERQTYYQDKVYMRGLIEFTNYCNKHCKYCGIRGENTKLTRYRLSKEEILDCCKKGYALGYRTFVLQGGEDPYYTDDKIVEIVSTLKETYPGCAITLSVGERAYASYKRFYEAGAERYLLRHETASKSLYESLHPHMSFENRIRCLENLKEIGYQVGTGFIVGLPGQTDEHIVEDLLFLKRLNPHMVGIGPFMPQKDTPLGSEEAGNLEQTVTLLSLIRIMLPEVLLPATTSLGSLHPLGREKGLKAGANVIMPNLSPVDVRDKYALYDGKIGLGDEAAESKKIIEEYIRLAGFKMDMSRGDSVRVGKGTH